VIKFHNFYVLILAINTFRLFFLVVAKVPENCAFFTDLLE